MEIINNNVILTILFVLFSCTTLTAQKTKSNSKERALSQFINSPTVTNNFKKWDHGQDSLIVFIDLNSIMNSDTLNKWQGVKVTVLKEGSLVDSLILFDARYLLKSRCNYYVLMSRVESKKITIVTLRHPCTNVVSNVKITEKNKQFYLGKIENAVW